MLANRAERRGRWGTHRVLLAVSTSPPTDPTTRSLGRPALLVYPTSPCSPQALGDSPSPEGCETELVACRNRKTSGERVEKREDACTLGPARASAISSSRPRSPDRDSRGRCGSPPHRCLHARVETCRRRGVEASERGKIQERKGRVTYRGKLLSGDLRDAVHPALEHVYVLRCGQYCPRV